VLDPQTVSYAGPKTRLAVVRQRGKRKDQYLDLADDDIVLDGWGLPFKTDTERVWAGNASDNLVGEPEAIRQLIEARAVAPVPKRQAIAGALAWNSWRLSCEPWPAFGVRSFIEQLGLVDDQQDIGFQRLRQAHSSAQDLV
jgi:hypothetical protein